MGSTLQSAGAMQDARRWAGPREAPRDGCCCFIFPCTLTDWAVRAHAEGWTAELVAVRLIYFFTLMLSCVLLGHINSLC